MRPDWVLLDADGNLMRSEEPAFDASARVMTRLFAEHGIDQVLDGDALRRAAMGRTFRSFSAGLCADAGVALDDAEVERWVATEKRDVIAHLGATLKPDEEVSAVLRDLASRFELAVVSSSALERLDACFRAIALDDLLPAGRRFSAEDSLVVPTSKPDPAVYLHAMAQLQTAPERCVAVEDAVSGARSAVAAGIPTIGNLRFVAEDEREQRRADLTAAGCVAVAEDWPAVAALLDGR